MPTPESELLIAFELHSVERIRAALDVGVDVRAPIGGKLPIDWLLEMYTRSDRFPACLRLLLERGAVLADPALAPVLLDDAEALHRALCAAPALIHHRTVMTSTFTPLAGATLLHVAAEYGHTNAARTLLDHGAEVDARAAIDGDGCNGHTPLFHTVNSNGNRALPVLRLLLEAGAQPDLLLPAITWGKGFDWETTFFDVTPISYAQCGLTRQMHRDEADVAEVIRLLLAAAGRPVPALPNIPNRYLAPRATGQEASARLARELFARLSAGEVESALNLLADDARWWIAGKPGAAPAAGVYTKSRLKGLMLDLLGKLDGGLRMTIKGITAQADRVAVEVESYGELTNGRVYNQEYHFLLEVRDGRISAVREYLDTQHVQAVWFAP